MAEVVFWNRLATDLGRTARMPPPWFSRVYALVHLSMHDALAIRSAAGALSLPEDLVAVGAAWRVLESQFNRERDRLVGEVSSRMRDGAEAREAVALGREVAEVILARCPPDRAPAPARPSGPGHWEGLLPHAIEAAVWEPLLVPGVQQGLAEPPYQLDSVEDQRDLEEVRAVSRTLTEQQREVARKWAGLPPPTIWNDMLNTRLLAQPVSLAEAVRRHAYLNGAMHDAFVSCWATKFKYWTARPFQRLADLRPAIPTPHFPSYTSGHATISGAAAIVMGAFYPSDVAWFEDQAAEAAASRLYGGIHFRHDNEEGLRVGRLIGQRAISLMQSRDSS